MSPMGISHAAGVHVQVPPPPTVYAEVEAMLFRDFITEGQYTLSVVDDPRNTDICDLVELAGQSQSLRAICVAYQASISVDQQENFYGLYAKALRHFRSAIVTPYEMGQDATLAAGLILCTIGMSRSLKWTLHLEGLISLLAYRESAGISNHSRPASYLIGVMGILDMDSFVVARQTTTHHIWRDYRRPSFPSTDQNQNIECSFGLPHSLLDLISRAREPDSERKLLGWVGEVGDFVQVHLWDAYRYGAILAQRSSSVLDLSPPQRQQPRADPTEFPAPSTEVLKHRILASVDAARRAAEDRHEYRRLRDGIRFPLFVAGSHCCEGDAKNKRYIQDCFDQMQVDVTLPRAKDILRLMQQLWDEGGRRKASDIARQWDIEVGLF